MTSYSPPTCGYSRPSELKQCGQVATILRMPGTRPSKAALSVSTFSMASCWKTNSLPMRRAGSPEQVSPEPRTANSTPAMCMQLGDGLGDLLGAVVDGAGAADPEQVLDLVGDRAVDHPDLEVELLDPLLADVAAHAPRVAAVLEVAQHHAGLGGEVRLDQRLVAAHVEDVVDVLDVDRALLDAGAAVGAAPQDVGVDDPALLEGADQRAVRLGVVGALDAGVARRPGLLVAGPQDVEVGCGLASRSARRAGTGPWRTGGPAGP